MQLFRVTQNQQLEAVKQADAAAAGLKETKDLEAWIRTRSDVFDRNDILWLSRQERTTSDERADLLGLCADELLQIELKRGTVPKEAVAQGLSYLARHAKSDRATLLQVFTEQAAKTGQWALRTPALDVEAAEDEFDRFAKEGVLVNQFRTLLLVGEEFDPETLQVCNLLNDSLGLNGVLTLECWKLQLFEHAGEFLCAFDKLLPSKDVEEEIAQRREERSAGKFKRDANRIEVMSRFKELCRVAGMDPKSKSGQSYECELALGDGTSAWLTLYRDENEPLVWMPTASALVKLAEFKQHPNGRDRDGEYWVVPVPCSNWDDGATRTATAERAAELVKLALARQT
jgi:hypothetical protein